MSKKKEPFRLDEHSDADLVHKLEERWDFITHIAPISRSKDERVFSCLDADTESTLSIDIDGWVLVRPNNSRFGDVLGAIE